ncbi:HAMP domain-containing sensor histidine kinase [Neomegalonema sp.]|uniref:sensor histidine kinase n=1 Tax=Neomegalonema sp. TaxID=2039713 RepID=UPI00260EE3C0|nr:hybrid sensor histidine kinase/response regulator [Neomegalonema sp.]MDD2867248.1 ATP-binding protein [Neomegalonema sp.]
MLGRLSQTLAVAAIGVLFAAAALLFLGSSKTLNRHVDAPRQLAEAQAAAADRLEAVRSALDRLEAALAESREPQDAPEFARIFREAAAQAARASPAIRAVGYFQAVEDQAAAELMAMHNAEGMTRLTRGAESLFLPLRFLAPGQDAQRGAFPFTAGNRLPAAYVAMQAAQDALRAAIGEERAVVSALIAPNGDPIPSLRLESGPQAVVWMLAPLIAAPEAAPPERRLIDPADPESGYVEIPAPPREFGRLKGVIGALIDARALAGTPNARILSGPLGASAAKPVFVQPSGMALMRGAESPWSLSFGLNAQRFDLIGATPGAPGVGRVASLLVLAVGGGLTALAWILLQGERSRGQVAARALRAQETQYKENLRKLKISEQQFKRLAESTGVIPWQANLKEQRFTYIGPQIETLTGYPPDSWYAVGFWVEHVHPDDRQTVIFDGMRKLRSGDFTTYEYRVRSASGRVVYLRNMMTLVAARGKGDKGEKPMLAHGFMLDVTEIKMAERRLQEARALAEESNRTKSEFLANMSHELRTPLNAVIGFSEVMKDQLFGPMDARYRDYAQNIHSSGRHLLSLINDVLDLAKIEAGRIELVEEAVDLPALLAGCRTLMHDRAASAGLHIRMEVPKPLPGLTADERRLKQVILNLMSNALKFTPPGGRVTLRAEVLEPKGLRIAVIDTGIGMTPEEVEIAREQFGQLDSELARQSDGTGLGLPIAESLIKLHGGELEIQSKKGVGTHMIVWLPMNRLGRAARDSAKAAG